MTIHYKATFGEQHPFLLHDCWGTIDGLKLYLQQAGNKEIQEQFYNGWTHDHYVTSVFCFCPDGTIPIPFFNVPGSVHDRQVAELGKIYSKLEHVFETMGGECCVDSAFGCIERHFLLKLGQHHLPARILGFFGGKKTSSVIFLPPTTKTPHALICSISLTKR
jgi:hypothetical protein